MEYHPSFYTKLYLLHVITTLHLQASDASVSSNNATVDTLSCNHTISGYLKQSETARYEFTPSADVYFDGCSSELDISFEITQSNHHWIATNDNPTPCQSSGSFLTFPYDSSYNGPYYLIVESQNELDYGNYSFTYVCVANVDIESSYRAPGVSRYFVVALSMSGLITFVGILILIEHRKGAYRHFCKYHNHADISTKEISLKESTEDRDVVEKQIKAQVPTATNTPRSPPKHEDLKEGDEDITNTHTHTHTNTTKDCDEQLLEMAMGSIISTDEHNVGDTAMECSHGDEMSTAL